MVIELKAAKRGVSGKGVQALRKDGLMPAIVYGPKQEALPVEMNQREFAKVLEKAGESTVISLSVDGEAHNVLIHEVDFDPVTSMARHADFYAIVKGQKVKVEVPLKFVGESLAVKQGANLVKAMHELEIEADPMNLPQNLTVDISVLAEIDAHITAKDIALPEGVTLVTGADEVVATVVEAKEEEVAPIAAPDMTAIETSVERGKKEEEGAPAE
ncbi:50S ribosomal protein L25 [Patescibacteria group bacterium]|nr:50S ribosomal protein L25 [Patescibacteria group bacterium]